MTKVYLHIVLTLMLLGCNSDTIRDPLPPSYVNTYVVLNTQDTQPLSLDRGFIYIDGGLKGIVLYNAGDSRYHAFERNCTYQHANDSARIAVDGSVLFMECQHCQSRFDFTGRVIAGPAQYPLRQYETQLQGNLLYIRGSY